MLDGELLSANVISRFHKSGVEAFGECCSFFFGYVTEMLSIREFFSFLCNMFLSDL